MHTAILRLIGGFHEVMLDGPMVFILPVTDKDVFVALRSTQFEGDALSLNLRDAGAEDHRVSRIRLLFASIGIGYDDVAHTEIRHVAGPLLRKTERQALHHAFMSLVGTQQRELVVDVSRLVFLFERIMPLGGKSRTLLRLVAHLREYMLVGKERQETIEIRTLHVRGVTDRIEDAIKLRDNVVIPKIIFDLPLPEISRCQSVEHLHTSLAEEHLHASNLVAKTDGFKEHLWCRRHAYQAIRELRVEQHRLHFPIGDIVVVIEDGEIQQQLHIMLDLLMGRVIGACSGHKRSLA